jgi:hypothetical protein
MQDGDDCVAMQTNNATDSNLTISGPGVIVTR